MSLTFLYLVVVILGLRTILFHRDEPVGWRAHEVVGALQVASLVVLQPSLSVIWLAASLMTIQWLAGLAEFHLRTEAAVNHSTLREFRAVLLPAQLLLAQCATSQFLGVSLRTDLGAWARDAAIVVPVFSDAARWPWAAILLVAAGALFVAGDANLCIRSVLNRFDIRPRTPATSGADEFGRGRVIGSLERLLVYALVLKGQYEALGLVLAAKGLARFPDLKQREFAEYFMVGTLLSLLIAGLVGEAVRILVT